MSSHTCYHCGGSGDENAEGESMGVCRVCLGSGFTHHTKPCPPKTEREWLWYLSDEEYAAHEQANEEHRRLMDQQREHDHELYDRMAS